MHSAGVGAHQGTPKPEGEFSRCPSQKCLQEVITEEMLLQTLPALPSWPPSGLGTSWFGFLIGMSLHRYISTGIVEVSIAE